MLFFKKKKHEIIRERDRIIEIRRESLFKKIFFKKKDDITVRFKDKYGILIEVGFAGMDCYREHGDAYILKKRGGEVDPDKYDLDYATMEKLNYYKNSNFTNCNLDYSTEGEVYTKDRKKVNITNQMYNMNRTNSPFTVDSITADKYTEELFYDLNNDAGTYMNTDADRSYSYDNSYNRSYDDF